MTPSGIEPATYRFVAQHLNHCAIAVPLRIQTIHILALLTSTCKMKVAGFFETSVPAYVTPT